MGDKRKKVRQTIDLLFPLQDVVVNGVKVELDFEGKVLRMKGPGDKRYRQLALWLIYEQMEPEDR